ncbi:CdaR family transcriptional regulator [Halopolyspora algeriensis]|uniref:CdaR family transcriptional regulator n=1 Tax=Halopolyspora algeriensis TaxID=1500506 RepID=A0A368VUN0_9ACTN|nr:helix-turn-helix domain-containing protein [Halopolyspora algeriensis]RCW43676.1 CdaR family transcriptional regulator [Halopolyspora algeriensis]TQM47541.1 CdaR family transcriptional regulator [Halopolyspora algeriensis]
MDSDDGAEHRRTSPESETAWLEQVAEAAGRAAGGVPVELLGDYLTLLVEAATTGRRPRGSELKVVRLLGQRAAELGVSAGSVVQLYLSATWRLWQQLPMVAHSRDSEAIRASAETFLRVIADAVATLAEGHTEARRQRVRWEETLRRELVDDLLRGDADVGSLVQRAEPFGLDLTRTHRVALAMSRDRSPEEQTTAGSLERAILNAFGDRDVLVATKEGALVVLVPAAEADAAGTAPPSTGEDLGALMHAELSRLSRSRPWQIAVGRSHPGPYGIARSYEEAREALTMAERLNWETSVIHAEELLIYRVLVRDQPAIADLVHAVLGPLLQARGGAEPLLATLEAYFATGGVATETARRLHLSVRAVTYRLDRVGKLTGYDPTDPAHRFTLHATVLGARLLGWPQRELPAVGD